VIGGIYFEIKLITKPPITQQSADEGFGSFKITFRRLHRTSALQLALDSLNSSMRINISEMI
jgi:hypothetical protein